MADTYAYDHDLPCRNPYCHSHGKPHPNCKCYNSGFSVEEHGYAKGGQVCLGPHKENCEYYADGGQVLENQDFENNPTQAIDHVGAQYGLHHILTKLGHNGRSENPHKHLTDYRDSVKRGRKTLDSHVSKILSPEKSDINPNEEGIASLKEHLNDLQLNPEKALDVGGQLSSSLPMHGAALGMKTAQTMNYLQSIKPMSSQNGPLDPVIPASHSKETAYDRQLGIAQNPMLVLHHVKKGTVQPQDLKTLHAVYPELGKSMVSKSAEALIDAKSKNMKIPKEQKHGLSALLGQPLDSISTPQAMQAIMRANAPIQQAQPQGKKKSGATAQTQKTIDKANEMFATPEQKRLMGKS